MNWVLVILVFTATGSTTSEQIGPYASSTDCEKAFAIVEQSGMTIQEHACVPVARIYGGDLLKELPEGFD